MLVTALVTPFGEGGKAIDRELVSMLTRFQLEEGAHQVLLAGTTGEGAALSDAEREELLDAALVAAEPEQLMLGLGFGRLDDVIARGRVALDRGVRELLLADCPYSGASSSALREHWHGAVAEALPEARLYPYAIPGRTGTEMLPDDLARLVEDHPNVVGVKDATGRLARMTRVRELCGPDFHILCGEDAQLRDAMLDPNIRADGAVSVVAHIAPRVVRDLVEVCRRGEAVAARALHERLSALHGIVTLTTAERVRVGGKVVDVPQRLKNPVPLKALLCELGIPVGTCRPPLGEPGSKALSELRLLARRLIAERDGPATTATDGLSSTRLAANAFSQAS